MWRKGLLTVCISLGFCGFLGSLRAAEPGKEDEGAKEPPKKAETKEVKEPKATEPKAGPDAVAKVDDVVISRTDLDGARRLFAMANPQVPLNNRQIVEQLINRILWSRYFDKHGLRPSQVDIQQAVTQLDAELRRRGSTYQNFLASQGLRAEDHLPLLNYDLAMRRLVVDIQSKIKPDEIKTEFDAHPDWYDGSRVRLSQIFVDTSDIANNPKEFEKAKQRIEQVYAQLVAGKDFDRLASDYSEGGTAGMGGDRGWFVRKGADVDEPLIAAVWTVRIGEYTKPILGSRGWQILKVTDREPAAFTFHGCKPRITDELTRRRLEALLDDMKAAAKIETYL